MAIEQQFDELVLAFTTSFEYRWNDGKSDGKHHAGFWHPIVPAGFYALGSIGVSGHEDPNGTTAALCVRPAQAGGSKPPPLALPTGYDRIWKDSNVGASDDGACWRPRPPSGYVALGDVFGKDHDTVPNLDDTICVRKDLAHPAQLGPMIYGDQGTKGDHFSAWYVAAPPFTDAELGLIAPNTFVGVASYDAPAKDPVMNVLMLRFPSPEGEEAPEPVLSGYATPADSTLPVVDRTVIVPFSALTDTTKSVKWKVDHSPFYKLERTACYKLVLFEHNNTSTQQEKSQEVTVGVESQESASFSIATGVSVTAEAGISFIASGKVSATVSAELGFQESTSVTELMSTTVVRSLSIPPQTAAGLWVTSLSLQAVRLDGASFAQPLVFEVDSFVSAQYPPVAGAQQKARVIDVDPSRIGAPVAS